jgi:hypothetical protein
VQRCEGRLDIATVDACAFFALQRAEKRRRNKQQEGPQNLFLMTNIMYVLCKAQSEGSLGGGANCVNKHHFLIFGGANAIIAMDLHTVYWKGVLTTAGHTNALYTAPNIRQAMHTYTCHLKIAPSFT